MLISTNTPFNVTNLSATWEFFKTHVKNRGWEAVFDIRKKLLGNNRPDSAIWNDRCGNLFFSKPKKYVQQHIECFSIKCRDSSLNYFDNDSGIHPGLQFLKSAAFVNPKLNLGMSKRAVSMPGIDGIHDAEFDIYQTKALEFQFEKWLNDLESIRNGIWMIKDVWLANTNVLPKLAKWAPEYGFLFFSSAEVERSFSKVNPLTSCDRKQFKPDSISKNLFLYFTLNV